MNSRFPKLMLNDRTYNIIHSDKASVDYSKYYIYCTHNTERGVE